MVLGGNTIYGARIDKVEKKARLAMGKACQRVVFVRLWRELNEAVDIRG